MSVLFVFYALVLVLAIVAAFGLYKLLAPLGKMLRGSLLVVFGILLILLWPIPIHGGFTFLGGALYDELSRWQATQIRQQNNDKKQQFVEHLKARFKGELGFSVSEKLAENWFRVQVKGNGHGWYESGSHLLWSEWLPLPSSTALPSLQSAKARCAGYPPAGYWSLSSEAENFLLWKKAGHQYLPKAPGASVSYLIDTHTQTEMPVYASGASSRQFSVRCVARSAGAPLAGYAMKNIPLAEWNHFQLLKSLH
ncbi:MAG: hypothetical protein KZQ58_04300 [gamma proteobacterium symbiont of Bathyaustriella thionipta]|nr:hypothetical protein [gamma proteobacterium symbiont of Bathyaustriella thionipta]